MTARVFAPLILLSTLVMLSAPAGAATVATDYYASSGGTPITIGGSASPQYSFFSGAYLGFFTGSDFIVGNEGSTVSFPDNGVAQPQLNQVATELGGFTYTDGDYQLAFDIGQTAYTGLATVDDQGTHISSITYNAVSSVSAAPEPGAWALLLGGVAGIGLMLRRRRAIGVITPA